jgi:ribonuclease PH
MLDAAIEYRESLGERSEPVQENVRIPDGAIFMQRQHDAGRFIELQGTAESITFDRAGMNRLLDLAQGDIADLIKLQKQALGL